MRIAEIEKLIDWSIFQRIFAMEVGEFSSMGKILPCQGKGRQNIFIDRKSTILGIAHLDSVQGSGYVKYLRDHPGGKLIFAPRCDDRLGVYTITTLLPLIGIQCDVLLTTDEECGNSTGADFIPEKQYNWIFQFDRMETEAVLYQFFGESKWREALTKAGFTTARGLGSDISKMSHMKCCGVNIGTGYHDYHSVTAYANVDEWLINVAKFKSFFFNYYKKHFSFKEYTPSYCGYHNWDRFDDANEYNKPFLSSQKSYQKKKSKQLKLFSSALVKWEFHYNDGWIHLISTNGTDKWILVEEKHRLSGATVNIRHRTSDYEYVRLLCNSRDLTLARIEEEKYICKCLPPLSEVITTDISAACPSCYQTFSFDEIGIIGEICSMCGTQLVMNKP